MNNLFEESYHRQIEPEDFVTHTTETHCGAELSHRYTSAWYILATTSQDQNSDDAINPYAVEQNRIIWNRFMCGDMPERKKKELSDKLNLPEDDFLPFEDDDWERLAARLKVYRQDNCLAALRQWKRPSQGQRPIIDFRHLNFDARAVIFDGFILNGIADFSNSRFIGKTSFSSACFLKRSNFSQATFDKPARFDEARFLENSDFSHTVFGKEASFRGSYFTKKAVFKGCTFELSTDFSDSTFSDTTSFHQTNFKSSAPRFFTQISTKTLFSRQMIVSGHKHHLQSLKTKKEYMHGLEDIWLI